MDIVAKSVSIQVVSPIKGERDTERVLAMENRARGVAEVSIQVVSPIKGEKIPRISSELERLKFESFHSSSFPH